VTLIDTARKITRGVGWKTLVVASLAVGTPLIWIVLLDGLLRLFVFPPLGSDPQALLNAGFAVGVSISLIASITAGGLYVAAYRLLRKRAVR
jgi:hypothetical protein